MLIYIIICILVVAKYLQKFASYWRKSLSIFSAAPGALGPLMILAENEKTDLSQVAMLSLN